MNTRHKIIYGKARSSSKNPPEWAYKKSKKTCKVKAKSTWKKCRVEK